ncbi:MAG TPA: lysozyme [Polyangiaceae bacterium]|nr:lysozyme [Polyangiaceae bacterium]
MSDAGLAFLAAEEGEVLHEYLDAGGKRTIGVGHLCREDERYPGGITHEQAIDLLRADVATAERAVTAAVTAAVTQWQFDALVSLAFNIGGGAFARSTLVRLLNNGDTGLAARGAWLAWCHVAGAVSPGLVARRSREWELFASGREELTDPATPAAIAKSQPPPGEVTSIEGQVAPVLPDDDGPGEPPAAAG